MAELERRGRARRATPPETPRTVVQDDAEVVMSALQPGSAEHHALMRLCQLANKARNPERADAPEVTDAEVHRVMDWLVPAVAHHYTKAVGDAVRRALADFLERRRLSAGRVPASLDSWLADEPHLMELEKEIEKAIRGVVPGPPDIVDEQVEDIMEQFAEFANKYAEREVRAEAYELAKGMLARASGVDTPRRRAPSSEESKNG